MGHYFAALHEPEAGRRAELVLLANVICGLHEQIGLQPHIAGAMSNPIESFAPLARVG